jgi:hypothetical protein
MVIFKRPFFWIILLTLGCIACLTYITWWQLSLRTNKNDIEVNFAIKKVNANYGRRVELLARRLGLPADYFKALILLECSANYPPGSRYEAHVFAQLLAVKEGNIPIYSGIRKVHLQGYSKRTLQQMATSWGPLQIMGYHAIHLGIHIDELKGEQSLYHGMVWAKKNYGHLLKRKAYRDAFHFHNTGKLYPKRGDPLTHDRYYVGNGLLYMKKLAEYNLTSQTNAMQ